MADLRQGRIDSLLRRADLLLGGCVLEKVGGASPEVVAAEKRGRVGGRGRMLGTLEPDEDI